MGRDHKMKLLPILGGLIVFLLISPTAFATEISTIEVSRFGNYDNIVIRTTGFVSPKAVYDEGSLKLEIILPEAKVKNTITIEKLKSPLIKSITAENYKEGSKVTFSLLKEIKFELANIFGRNRVLLEITDAPEKEKKAKVEEKEKEKAEEKSDKGGKEAAAPPPASISLKSKEEAIKKQEEKKPEKKAVKKEAVSPLKGKVIVIDPGHGGLDGGSIGKRGSLEKNLTLPIALKLRNLLVFAGAKVILTREKDITTDYREIVRAANGNNADIFIAIHYNSSESPRVAGTETFYYTENSKKLAQIVHKNLVREIRRRDRWIRRGMFYVIHYTKMPSILIEPGYITDSYEERLAGSKAFQSEVAQGLYRGLLEYSKRIR